MLINRIFTLSLVILCFSTAVSTAAHSEEFPVYRVTSVDTSNYDDEYTQALNNDPYESFNRAMFDFNDSVDGIFFEPVARVYNDYVPEWGRNRVTDFFNNLGEINNFFNAIFQGDVEGTFRAFTRFGINTTLGIGGLHDLAGGFGLKEKEKTFSQTLALYGLGAGDYLVLPFLGPSTARDFTGDMFGRTTDPSTYITSGYLSTAFGLVDLIDTRSNLLNLTDEIELTSFDPYSAYKSSYLQYKKKQLVKTIE